MSSVFAILGTMNSFTFINMFKGLCVKSLVLSLALLLGGDEIFMRLNLVEDFQVMEVPLKRLQHTVIFLLFPDYQEVGFLLHCGFPLLARGSTTTAPPGTSKTVSHKRPSVLLC